MKKILLLVFLFPVMGMAQTTIIKCGNLIDGKSAQPLGKKAIVIEGKLIKEIIEWDKIPAQSNIIDLSSKFVLPGLIDCHTHVMLQGDITNEEYDAQVLTESIPYRTLRAAVACNIALMNGFTTMRDVETEGAMYADVDIKKAINNGVIPGPRMVVSTRALDVTGAYPLQGYAPEVQVPHGVQLVDGPYAARQAVREQISYGADWIKVYSDRAYALR